MASIPTLRFAGLKAPPSPEVEAGPFPTTRAAQSQVTFED